MMPETEHPIIFSSDMVRAILDGRKTQTHRVIRPQPYRAIMGNVPWCWQKTKHSSYNLVTEQCLAEHIKYCGPYGKPGDVLWVREALVEGSAGLVAWRESAHSGPKREGEFVEWLWKRSPLPARYMPRWACRLLLRVKEVRPPHRIQEISEANAIAEGIQLKMSSRAVAADCLNYDGITAYQASFALLWDSLNAKRGHPWSANDWVWPVTFERIK